MTNPLLNTILVSLAPQPRSDNVNDDPGFWTDGKKIFCPSETECKVVAEFLRDMFSEIYDTEISCGKDEHTGFYYVSFE